MVFVRGNRLPGSETKHIIPVIDHLSTGEMGIARVNAEFYSPLIHQLIVRPFVKVECRGQHQKEILVSFERPPCNRPGLCFLTVEYPRLWDASDSALRN